MKTKTYVKGVAALCALAAVACTGVQQSRGDVAVYLDESQPLEKRVEDALSRLTLEEKVGLLHAQSKFSSAGVPAAGHPRSVVHRRPARHPPEVLWDEWDQAGWTNDSCTAFPALTCLAATWNPRNVGPLRQDSSARRRVTGIRTCCWAPGSTSTARP